MILVSDLYIYPFALVEITLRAHNNTLTDNLEIATASNTTVETERTAAVSTRDELETRLTAERAERTKQLLKSDDEKAVAAAKTKELEEQLESERKSHAKQVSQLKVEAKTLNERIEGANREADTLRSVLLAVSASAFHQLIYSPSTHNTTLVRNLNDTTTLNAVLETKRDTAATTIKELKANHEMHATQLSHEKSRADALTRRIEGLNNELDNLRSVLISACNLARVD